MTPRHRHGILQQKDRHVYKTHFTENVWVYICYFHFRRVKLWTEVLAERFHLPFSILFSSSMFPVLSNCMILLYLFQNSYPFFFLFMKHWKLHQRLPPSSAHKEFLSYHFPYFSFIRIIISTFCLWSVLCSFADMEMSEGNVLYNRIMSVLPALPITQS